MAKFDIKTVKPKFVVTTSPENKIDVVVNKPIIETKLSKSFFKLKNTGGPKGVKGDKGEPGQDSTIEVVSTTTGAAGTNASVVNQGTASAAQLAFTIPRGDKGDKGNDGAAGYSPTATVSKSGDTATITITDKNGTTTASISDGQDGAAGAPGQAATIAVDSTSTLPAGSSATVTNVGTSSAARLAFGIPKGDTGAAGADGDAATITVGQVETLQPNQSAYVTNVGTSSAAVFNIGIPKGDKGDSGSGSGDMTASVYDPNGTVAAAGGIPDYVDSNGGKIDTIEVNGTPQTITNKTVDIAVPTDTSDLTNGAGYITSSSLPTVNNATLTIQKNGTTVQTFTANSSSDKTANITVPTDTSDLTNGAGYITSSALPTKTSDLQNDGADGTSTYVEADDLATVATSGAYNDLSGKPTIPTVNNGTLTVTQNGTSKGTFTANSSSNETIALTDTTYSDFTGATSLAAGAAGLVPAPTTSDPDKFLKGDGTWATVSGLSDRLYRMLVPEGTEITANKNLNTTEFLKVDKYYCPSNATVSTLTNCPTGDAFMMEVLSPLSTTIDNETTGTWVYRTRLITTFTGELYIQTASSGSTPGSFTYGSWKRYDNVNDATLTIQKNGTTVKTFTANASSNVTANITVPTQFSELSGTVATAQIAANAVTKAKVDDSGLKNANVTGAYCYYRRSGHFVWVSGNAASFALTANSYKTIFTLPSGYRPSIDIYCPLGLSSASALGILRIRTSGEVQGWAATNTTYWNFSTTFAID